MSAPRADLEHYVLDYYDNKYSKWLNSNDIGVF
jgi:hypothetical protein